MPIKKVLHQLVDEVAGAIDGDEDLFVALVDRFDMRVGRDGNDYEIYVIDQSTKKVILTASGPDWDELVTEVYDHFE